LCNPLSGNARWDGSVTVDVRGVRGIAEERSVGNYKIYSDGSGRGAADSGDSLDEEIGHDLSARAIVSVSQDGIRISHQRGVNGNAFGDRE
jgi:hypothetical protein